MSDQPQKTDIGNPKDVQGILAISVVGGAFAIAGVALAKGADATQILGAVLPLASLVTGFYFGVKSQQ